MKKNKVPWMKRGSERKRERERRKEKWDTIHSNQIWVISIHSLFFDQRILGMFKIKRKSCTLFSGQTRAIYRQLELELESDMKMTWKWMNDQWIVPYCVVSQAQFWK